MHPDEQLTAPLGRLLWRGVVRLLTLEGFVERWSHLSAVRRAERRARWPAWRRAVRPVGLALFWIQSLLYLATGDDPGPVVTALRFGSILLLVPIALIGIRDWLRDVPPKRAVPARSLPTAAGSAPLPGPLPGTASEDPPA